MTIAELVNSVDISVDKQEKTRRPETAKTICAVIFGIHVTLMLWHVSYWF